MYATKRFHMVLHNYDYDDLEDIESVFHNCCDYYVIGREVAPNMHVKHLQMYAEFKSKILFKQLRELFSASVRSKIHIESAKKNRQANCIYCTKGRDYKIWDATEGSLGSEATTYNECLFDD